MATRYYYYPPAGGGALDSEGAIGAAAPADAIQIGLVDPDGDLIGAQASADGFLETNPSFREVNTTGLDENSTLTIPLNGATSIVLCIEVTSGTPATTYIGTSATPSSINTGRDIIPRVWSYDANTWVTGSTVSGLNYQFPLNTANGKMYRVSDIAGFKNFQLYVNSSAGPIVWRVFANLTGAVYSDVTDANLCDGVGTRVLVGQKTMASSLPVVIASDQGALPITISGVATAANQTAEQTLTGAVTETAPATDTASSGLNGRLQRIAQRLTSLIALIPASLGQKTAAASLAVTVASDQSAIPASQSGTWNISNVSGTITLPTGAATGTKQDTGNTSLSSIDGKFGSLGQKAMTGSAPVVLASDQSAVATKAPVNAAGSNTDSTVSTVATLTAPANAVGFILMNLDTSSASIRWRVGATASASSGQQLQAGRDTGFIPLAANISICAESGTQNYNVQWVLSA